MLAWVEDDGVPLLVWRRAPGVVAAFSGRRGGVSDAPYASLNVGMRSGDDHALVRENRRRLCRAVGADPRRTSSCFQVHGAEIHRAPPVVDGGDFLSGIAAPPEGDGLHTDEPGRAIVVFAADCVPVALARADGSAIAVCHAGWPGLVAGAVEAAAATLGEGPLVAAVGPCAGPQRYEVRDDVGGPLRARFGDDVVRDGRADLPLCAERALRRSGVEDVDVGRPVHHRRSRALLLASPRRVAGRPAVPHRVPGGGVTLDPADVAAGVAGARERIVEAARRAGREASGVEIVAAVKYVDVDDLPSLHAAGIRRAGENRAEQLLAKQAAHGDLFTWDFIGHLQSRKVRDVVGRVALVHALQSDSAASQIDTRSSAPQDVLVEVNTAADPSKHGVAPDGLDAFLELLAGLERVRVRGMMTMPALAEEPEDSRAAFAALRELAARAAERWAGTHAFDVLSMGTSQDFAVAVEEGATLVRLGSVLLVPPGGWARLA